MRAGLILAALGSSAGLATGCVRTQHASSDAAVASTVSREARPDLYQSVLEARRWLGLALANNRHAQTERIDWDCWGYRSQLGHFSKPFETHEAKKSLRLAMDLTRDSFGLIETTTDGGMTTVDKTVVAPGLLFRAHDGEIEQGPFSPSDLEQTRLEFAELSPVALLRAALNNGALMLNRTMSQDASTGPSVSVTFTGDDKVTRSVAIDRHSGTLARLTSLYSDPMLGDQLLETEYTYDLQTNSEAPRTQRFRSGRLELDLQCRRAASNSPDALETPAGYSTKLVVPPVSAPATTTTVRVSDGLYAVTFSALNSRSLFLVHNRGVYVFEAPHGDEAGQLLLDTIRRQVPDKPIQYLFLTHHHPDHAGGLRPFVAAGVKLVTTVGNVSYFQSVANEKHALRPDAQWLHPLTPVFELVSGRREFSDGGQSVTALELGKQTDHTNEYLIFYFPKANLIFEGDLVKALPDGEPLGPAGPRAAALYRYLISSHLQVDRIVSSWPARGRSASLPFATLAEMVRLSGNVTSPSP